MPLPVEAWLPRAISGTALRVRGNSDEQDETIVRSVPSDDGCSHQGKKNVAQDVERSVVCHPAERAQSGAAVPKQSSHAGREPRRNSPSTPSQLTSRITAVAKLDAGAGRLDNGPDQQVADESSVRDQSHREDRPAEQGPRREDQGLRRPYIECVRQPNCDIA